FLTALDQTVVVTAIPQMIQDLQIQAIEFDRAAWIISGYLLGYVIAMPLMGRISDMYGRRRVFIICLLIFACGSLFCGLAPFLGENVDLSFLQNIGINVSSPGLVWLVGARFVQAAGGGAVVPVAMAVASDFYGEKRLGVALGLVGMVTEAGGVLGPLYGSLIVQSLGWRYIFFLNIPIIAVLLLLTWFFIPPSAHLKERIDLPGALLLGASLVCLSLGLSQEAAQITPGISGPGTAPVQNNPWLLAAALLLLAAFIFLEIFSERRGRWPVIELSLFRRRAFAATAVVSLLVGAALIIAMADIPIFIATVLGRPAIDSGLALLRLTAMIPVGALIGGWLCARISCRLTAVLGLIPTAIGFWLMHLWPLNVDWTQITISTLIGGLGFGLVIAPIGTTAIHAARNRQAGMASSVVTVLRMIGMILGLAGLTSWGLGRWRALAASFVPPAGVTPFSAPYNKVYGDYLIASAHEVYTAIFLAAGVLCLIALVPAFFLLGREPAAYLERTTDRSTPSLDQGGYQPESEITRSNEQRQR
ncbi:MAG: MFS transporter, partial [Ktedonobacteraceae bacterium]|nr:MFS transporter [Ktedonobacteraceae bacterium]